MAFHSFMRETIPEMPLCACQKIGGMRDFRLPSSCRWELCSSWMLRSVEW